MATTDTRTGFRLPWSSDHREPDEDAGGVDTADETSGPEGAEASAAEPTEVAEPAEAAEPTRSTTDQDDDMPVPAHDSTTGSTAGAASAASSTGSASVPFGADVYAPQATTAKKPSKFLADLTAAMRTAAESERVDIVDRFQADAKAYIESIHERSSGDVVDLRKQADEDIVEIRDWSKAEIARIREETDRKITGRKQDLDEELEAHAARVEREIERIRSTVDGFEAQMAAFFEGLLAVDDPTRFAAMAANLPEPPSLEQVAAGTAKVTAPAVPSVSTVPSISPDVPTGPAADSWGEPQPSRSTPETPATEPTAAAEPATDSEHGAITGSASAEPAAALDPWRGATFAGTNETGDADQPPTAEVEASDPGDPEAVTSDGATAEASTADTEGAPTADDISEATTEAMDVTADATAAIVADAVDQASAETVEPEPGPEPEPEATSASDLDPRVAALGLTPDLAAAEAEALSGYDAEDDGSSDAVPVFDEDAIAARLATFSASPESAPEAVKTQVIVTGLASVASISGFKRTLAQVAGVRGVSVASGPDGEFVFSVTHGPTVELTAVIPSMNGFAARVMGAEDGVLRVAAHDPEAGS